MCYPGFTCAIQATHGYQVIRYTWATHVLSIWLSDVYPRLSGYTYAYPCRVIQGYLATHGIQGYLGYTHIGYTHMC